MSKALSVGLGVPSSCGTYSAALEGLTGVNEVLMRRDPSIPPLYESGARWELRPNDPSDTRWRYADEVATEGWGDCQALAAYRAAELRVNGTDPQAHVRVYPTGENKYHAVVARGDGRVEDPSVALGMMPFPGAPMTHDQLPAVQGPAGGYPGGGSPGLDPDAIQGAKKRIIRAVCGLHPYAAMCGMGAFGDETGLAPKLARVRDAAPEYGQPTVHITPHRCGSVTGWKGVHRIPLKDGTAIVGMTKTHRHPANCVGDVAGLISDIASGIAKSPALLWLLSPFSAGTTLALQDPTVQHALGSVGRSVKTAIKEKGDGGSLAKKSDGWPDDWSVSGPPDTTDMAIVGWGLSNLASLVTDPLNAAKNLITHPSLTNLGKLGLSPLTGALHTIYRPSSGGGGPQPGAMPAGGAIGRGGPIRVNPQALATRQAQSGQSAQYVPPGFDPTTYLGMSIPGFPTMPPYSAYPVYPGMAYNATTHSYQPPQFFNPDPNAWNAPTAADYGLGVEPFGGAGTGAPTEADNLAAAFSDPYAYDALASYNPMGGGSLGYWNTPGGGYMPLG